MTKSKKSAQKAARKQARNSSRKSAAQRRRAKERQLARQTAQQSLQENSSVSRKKVSKAIIIIGIILLALLGIPAYILNLMRAYLIIVCIIAIFAIAYCTKKVEKDKFKFAVCTTAMVIFTAVFGLLIGTGNAPAGTAVSPSPAETAALTPAPANTPTPEPTEAPTNTPTPKPTEVPTNTPAPKPTEVPTNTPTSTEAPRNTETPMRGTAAPRETEYITLRLGSTGPAVDELTEELRKQGFYSGRETDKYDAAVVDAVQAFQIENNLEVDGIAGPKTLHKLYGTVPIDTAGLKMDFYPAEEIDWDTGIIDELWPVGTEMKIYDVKSRIIWKAYRTGGDGHVEAEPASKEDTKRLYRTYGITKAREFTDNMLFQRRPLLITAENRTIACSLYGMPHSGQKKDAIADNNFKGQLCIHFTNSRTHNGKVDSGHQAAIEYAVNNAPEGNT